MKALVLTYDDYRPFTRHMISTYSEHWPDHPFTFVVPYNNHFPRDLKKSFGDRVQPVQTDKAIKHTVFTLLDEVSEDEWFYWAPDDKYLIEFRSKRVGNMAELISAGHFDEIDGISFVRDRSFLDGTSLVSEKKKVLNSYTLYLRRDYSHIWLPQFLKGKVLRYLFQEMPDPKIPKEMDYLKQEVDLPDNHKLFVTGQNYAVFGESTTRGKITKNCVSSLNRYDISINEGMEVSNEHITVGSMNRIRNLLYQNSVLRSFYKGTNKVMRYILLFPENILL